MIPEKIVLRFAFLCLAAVGLTGMPSGHASPFYEFHVVAESGQADGSGNTLSSFSAETASINDRGKVAFVGQNNLGQSIYLGDGQAAPTIISFSVPSSTRFYSNGVQVNNSNQVIARDRSGSTNLIRVWEGDTPGAFTTIVRGNISGGSAAFPAAYSSVFSHPTVSNVPPAAANPYVAFTALDIDLPQPDTVVATPNAYGETRRFNFNEVRLDIPLRPMIADTGDIVIRAGSLTTDPIRVYDNTLASFQTIADSGSFNSLGRSPGISADGTIVAFTGDRGNGPGVFISILVGGSFAGPFLVAGENGGASPSAELGFDDAGGRLYIDTLDADARVGVIRSDFGPAGIANDVVIVSFIGTPNAASRDNPSIAGNQPLTFSANEGLWTVRVDIDPPLVGGGANQVHVNSPMPVVQIGETVQTPSGGKQITALAVYDPIAKAARDTGGAVRTQRPGDHRLGFVALAGADSLVLRASHLDSDLDGALDHWETTGIDMDQDGVVDLDLPAFGANVNARDLFLEIDWTNFRTSGNVAPYRQEPPPGAMQAFANMFQNAPALAGARYGLRSDGAAPANIPAGVTAHVDAGSGNDLQGNPFSQNIPAAAAALRQGGDLLGMPGTGAHPDVVYFGQPNAFNVPGLQSRSFHQFKDSFFGTTDKRARELVFHYSILADFYTLLADIDGDGDINVDEGISDFATFAPFVGQVAAATAGDLTASAAIFETGANSISGDAVLITQGTGAGQVRVIAGVPAANRITVAANWATVPDNTSQFVLLTGSSGLGEAEFRGDFSSRPGNDHIVTFGAWSITQTPQGNYLTSPRSQWQTMAHEAGHTLGLRHGGNNHTNNKPTYNSLMNYLFQTTNGPSDYARPGDAVFEDWNNLRMDFFSSAHFIGNTFGLDANGAPNDPGPLDELNQTEFEELLGEEIDAEIPAVAIVAPAPGADVASGTPLAVTVTATDNVGVDTVTVFFDTDGDGVEDVAAASATGGGNYEAVFASVTGADGARDIRAQAVDDALHVATATISVNVGAGEVLVPDVVGLGQAAAEIAIAGAGLAVGTVSEENSDTVPAGDVISQDPAAGASVAPGSAVDIVVSLGSANAAPSIVSAPVTIAVEGDLYRYDVEADDPDAGDELTFSLDPVATPDGMSIDPATGLIEWTPAPTQLGDNDVTVLVTDDGGLFDSQSFVIQVAPAPVVVPQVIGLSSEAAEAAIIDSNLAVGAVVTENSDEVPEGNVIDQDPPGGTEAAAGTAVDLIVSLGPAALEPISDLAARAKSGKISLYWSPVPGADGYNVYRSMAPGGPYDILVSGHQTDFATYLDDGLTDGTTYYYVVTWSSPAGESPASNEASATPTARSGRR